MELISIIFYFILVAYIIWQLIIFKKKIENIENWLDLLKDNCKIQKTRNSRFSDRLYNIDLKFINLEKEKTRISVLNNNIINIDNQIARIFLKLDSIFETTEKDKLTSIAYTIYENDDKFKYDSELSVIDNIVLLGELTNILLQKSYKDKNV